MDYISDQVFENIDYADSPLKVGAFEYCTFKHCDFSTSDFSEMRFMETEFSYCNLSNIKVHNTSFQNTKFKNCKMLGLQFDSCNDFGFAIQCESSMLNHSVFYKMLLSKSSFNDCQLLDTDFAEADLKGCALTKCNFQNAIFDRTNLQKADLRESIHFAIDPEGNNIVGAKFSASEAIRLLDRYKLIIE